MKATVTSDKKTDCFSKLQEQVEIELGTKISNKKTAQRPKSTGTKNRISRNKELQNDITLRILESYV